ncbi:MAG: IS66 family insertion sequence element accessory protein TnpB [Candidatus Binatus sp.]
MRVFVARGATDLRRSFDRLSAQVQEVLRQDPLSQNEITEPASLRRRQTTHNRLRKNGRSLVL